MLKEVLKRYGIKHWKVSEDCEHSVVLCDDEDVVVEVTCNTVTLNSEGAILAVNDAHAALIELANIVNAVRVTHIVLFKEELLFHRYVDIASDNVVYAAECDISMVVSTDCRGTKDYRTFVPRLDFHKSHRIVK